jgi:hypothetical protein
MGLFDVFKTGLTKTRDKIASGLRSSGGTAVSAVRAYELRQQPFAGAKRS